MKRTKRMTLNAAQSAWLDGTIARNRQYAGMRMMADDDKGGDGGDDDKKSDDDQSSDDRQYKGGDDDKLGEGGKKALQAERDRAKAAEAAATEAQGQFAAFKAAMLEGFGIKPDDDKGEDALAALQAEMKKLQDKSAIDDLAHEYKITDTKDLSLLKSATDPEARKALAERLAPAEDDSDTTSRRRGIPKPDRTQGGGGGGGDDKPRGGSVAQVMEERRAARAAKKTTNV